MLELWDDCWFGQDMLYGFRSINQNSIVPWEDETPASSMSFPPPRFAISKFYVFILQQWCAIAILTCSKTLESTTSTKRKHHDSCSEVSKRYLYYWCNLMLNLTFESTNCNIFSIAKAWTFQVQTREIMGTLTLEPPKGSTTKSEFFYLHVQCFYLFYLIDHINM